MKKVTLLLALLLFMGMNIVQAQKTISGTVTNSDDGEAIPGATVLVKNTTIGTTTNEDGYYELTVPQEARSLVFSFVGRVSMEVQIGTDLNFHGYPADKGEHEGSRFLRNGELVIPIFIGSRTNGGVFHQDSRSRDGFPIVGIGHCTGDRFLCLHDVHAHKEQ